MSTYQKTPVSPEGRMTAGETSYIRGRNNWRFHYCEKQAVQGSEPDDTNGGVPNKETPNNQPEVNQVTNQQRLESKV